MYDGHTQLRRMVVESYRPLYERLDVTRSLYEKMNSYSKLDSVASQLASQLAYPHELLRAQLDSYLPTRNLLDQFRIERDLLNDALPNLCRPQVLAQVDKTLAQFQLNKSLSLNFASALADSLAAKHRTLEAGHLASLNDSYSRLAALQRSLALQSEDLAARLDQLTPVLSAQSNWARTLRFPSSLEEAGRLTEGARTLFDQISELYASWKDLQCDFEDEREDEQVEQAIALANERLAVAFAEKNPVVTVQRIRELLAHLKSGALRLAPHGKKFLVDILIHLVAAFIFHYSLEHYTGRRAPEVPRVSKEATRAVRKIQKEGVSFPNELRVVIASELMVRRGPRQSTLVVGRLYAGDVVFRVDVQRRSWSLVEFQDEEGEVVLRGWVFSGYIKPLNGCAYHPCRSW